MSIHNLHQAVAGEENKPANSWGPVIPNTRDWPIFKFTEHRAELLEQLKSQSKSRIIGSINGDESGLVNELSRTLYLERIRLHENPWKADPEDEIPFWKGIKNQLLKQTPGASGELAGVDADYQQQILDKIINRYSVEIAGHFDPSVYEFAKKLVPFGFSRLLKTNLGQRYTEQWKERYNPSDKIHLTGDIDTVRSLAKKATLIMVPTHFSNIDSILIGWAIQAIGLPAFIYGAGLNLFSIKLLSYFMDRLGAYKVDRRKKNQIYLETLKTYSSLAI